MTSLAPDAEAGPWETGAIGTLSDRLAALYPTPADMRRVITDAGLDAGRLVREDEALAAWFRVLIHVGGPGQIEAIVAVARVEYPGDEGLARAVERGTSHTRQAVVQEAARALAAVPEPTAAAAPQPATPLVDRVDAVAMLRSGLEGIGTQQTGAALLLTGDSGVGKTRLTECAMGDARERDMLVLLAKCVAESGEPL